jgi:O-antigen/teichoic acid export membrane protein
VNGALTGYALGNVLAFTAALVALWPLLRRNGGQELPVGSFDGLNRYAVSVLVINLSLMVMASVDQVAVKHFFSEEVAGNYAVAFLLGRVIGMSTIALSWVIFARATTMVPDDPRRVRLLAKGLFVIGAIAVTFTAGFNAAPTLAVRMLGGSQYLIADAYVGLVGIEMTLFALVYVQAYYHISTGETRILWPLCFALLLEIALLARYHATVEQILLTLILVMSGLLLLVSAVSWWVLSDGANRLSKTE